jgi:hypothetical protein
MLLVLLRLLRLLRGGCRGRATITTITYIPIWGWGIPFGTSTLLRPRGLTLLLLLLALLLLGGATRVLTTLAAGLRRSLVEVRAGRAAGALAGLAEVPAYLLLLAGHGVDLWG